DVRFTIGVIAVVEFSDLPLADRLAEGLEAARLLGNGHGDDRFTLLAQLGTLGDVAQAVKIDIGAGVDGDQHLAGDAFAGNVFLDARDAQRTGWLGDRAGVLVDVLDRRAQLV